MNAGLHDWHGTNRCVYTDWWVNNSVMLAVMRLNRSNYSYLPFRYKRMFIQSLSEWGCLYWPGKWLPMHLCRWIHGGSLWNRYGHLRYTWPQTFDWGPKRDQYGDVMLSSIRYQGMSPESLLGWWGCTDKVNHVNCACPERFSGDCLKIGMVLIDVCIGTDESTIVSC